MPKLVLLWTDAFLWLIVAGVIAYVVHVRRSPNLAATWRRVFAAPAASSTAILLTLFIVTGLADSVHFRLRLDDRAYSTQTFSVLDVLMDKQRTSREKSYSAPLAYESFMVELVPHDGVMTREHARLAYGGRQLSDPAGQWVADVCARAVAGLVLGALIGLAAFLFSVACIAQHRGQGLAPTWQNLLGSAGESRWRAMFATGMVTATLLGAIISLSAVYHVFGTDRTGNDVYYQAVKSIRTALVMGSLTTAAILPFALILGVMSGYLRGWVDDVIQYFYTLISAIPAVLLIAASVLLIQVFLDKHPEVFQTALERADVKLLFLCLIVGVTEFATMCRLIRGETLKLRELEFVQAAQAFGVGAGAIMRRHIVPNVMHVVITTLVLEFSGIVLYEAVLSYVGVGVDPSTNSFGTMINLARSEMAREPLVWWNLVTAFTVMLTLVLSVNLFADAVREAFDPRARLYRARRVALLGARP